MPIYTGDLWALKYNLPLAGVALPDQLKDATRGSCRELRAPIS